MNGDAPQLLEATRLALKFFPESTAFLSLETGLNWEAFLGAMMSADYHADYSCDPFRKASDPDLGLAASGGLKGADHKVYARLLKHTGLQPQGRAVVVPDAIGRRDWSTEPCLPLVCHCQRLPERLAETPCFGPGRNTVILFENGQALLVDHDDRVHWATSRQAHA